MLLNEHKFTIDKLTAVQETKKNQKKFVVMKLRKAAPTDEFGQPITEDDIFELTVWERDFQKLQGFKTGDKVLCQLYLNGRDKLSENSQEYNQITMSIRQIKHFVPEQQKK